MSGPLQALVRAYENQLKWTLALPHLGLPGVVRLAFADFDALPQPEIGEFGNKTEDPTILCVERIVDGRKALVPLRSHVSGAAGRTLVRQLVRLGVHPLDIVVATWSADTDSFVFRTSVDHLMWTHEDQRRLEAEIAAAA